MSGTLATDAGRKCLRLQLTPELGPRRFAQLLERCSSVDAMLGMSAGALAGLNHTSRKTAETIARGRDQVDVDSELARAEQLGARIICRLDDDYPVLLRYVADPPICLYVRGTLRETDGLSLAIVGSRQCSHYGREQARRFGYLLAQAGMTIVSGLAAGVDTFAHYGALDIPDGRTIAVLGCGLATVYPPENTALAERIADSGAVISELPLDTPTDRTNFPARNRIIAGMTLGTLVVECRQMSGALITARHAIDYDREVFAIPGQIDTPQSRGTNKLIAESQAKLVTCREDILDELGDAGRTLLAKHEGTSSVPAPPSGRPAPTLDADEQQVFDAIGSVPRHVDEIAEQCGQSMARVAATLITLQLKGVAKQLPGSMYAKRNAECGLWNAD